MLSRGLDNARIGSLSLITGDLAIFDLAVIQTAWGLRHVQSVLLDAMSASEAESGNRHARRQAEKARSSKPSPVHEATIEMLKTFPHAVLATVGTAGQTVWSSLRDEGLMVSASDLLLKHGVSVPGAWSMVGIIDAFPDDGVSMDQGAASESLGSLGPVIAGLGPAIRTMLGRPSEAYGMTPLLIFREVSG